MNTQELFSKIANHLLAQNCLSEDTDGCVYRAPNGMKCALGILITDEVYASYERDDDPEEDEVPHTTNNILEGGSMLYNECVRKAVETSIGRTLEETEVLLLCALQQTHDSNEPSHWRSDLLSVSKEFELQMV